MAYAPPPIIGRFRVLHEAGCFVIPNPWDIGSARYLSHLGFQAVATTSAGFAFSMGQPDAEVAVGLDETLTHIASIVAAVPELPVNADFQSGYAHRPEDVATNVERCLRTGVAGLSIEDASGEPEAPLYPIDLAGERIKAARRAIDASGTGALLTARAECYLVGHPDPLNESIKRLRAYAEAGADVLYAPGPHSADPIKAIVDSVAPKPVNVLMSRPSRLTSIRGRRPRRPSDLRRLRPRVGGLGRLSEGGTGAPGWVVRRVWPQHALWRAQRSVPAIPLAISGLSEAKY